MVRCPESSIIFAKEPFSFCKKYEKWYALGHIGIDNLQKMHLAVL